MGCIPNLARIRLLKPGFSDKGTLMKALKQRQTIREIDKKILSPQMLSDLLWAACGVNRKRGPFDIPGRTSATASNSQEIDVYVALKEGTYLYDAYSHSLIPVTDKDLRKLATGGGQVNFGNEAPVRLIFVADIDRLNNTRGYREPGLLDPEIQKAYYYVDTGIIAANVYFFAASPASQDRKTERPQDICYSPPILYKYFCVLSIIEFLKTAGVAQIPESI